MEFNVSSAELLKGLSDVSRAIPAKSPTPILENFLFVAKDGNLQITASDQELTLRTNIAVDVKEEGSMAVPAHQIMDLIKALPDQPVSFRTTSDLPQGQLLKTSAFSEERCLQYGFYI